MPPCASLTQLLIAAVVGGLVASAIPAVAVIGGFVTLGQANNAQNATTRITSTDGSSTLQLVNNEQGQALDLHTDRSVAPMGVSSARRVPRLNDDRVDGKHAPDFLGAGATVADSDLLDRLYPTAFLGETVTAINADKVDDKHANQLIRAAFGSDVNAADTN